MHTLEILIVTSEKLMQILILCLGSILVSLFYPLLQLYLSTGVIANILKKIKLNTYTFNLE